ncbi:MAG: class I SAM-dependent methyltransferase [Planctomycetes bacterium]|nr:class I SAM-dependent methyltransferase [Planctomycetota bacterium]
MKAFDRFLQRWRISKAAPHVPQGARVVDVGCSDGALFHQIGDRLSGGVGLDPALPPGSDAGPKFQLVRGLFPGDLPERGQFGAITALAVLEHLEDDELAALAVACADRLVPGGRVVATVPSPLVDPILHVLQALRIIDGMHVDEHHEMEPDAIPKAFVAAGFKLTVRRRFQLGLNNLFVFEKPATPGERGPAR